MHCVLCHIERHCVLATFALLLEMCLAAFLFLLDVLSSAEKSWGLPLQGRLQPPSWLAALPDPPKASYSAPDGFQSRPRWRGFSGGTACVQCGGPWDGGQRGCPRGDKPLVSAALAEPPLSPAPTTDTAAVSGHSVPHTRGCWCHREPPAPRCRNRPVAPTLGQPQPASPGP